MPRVEAKSRLANKLVARSESLVHTKRRKHAQIQKATTTKE